MHLKIQDVGNLKDTGNKCYIDTELTIEGKCAFIQNEIINGFNYTLNYDM